MRACDDDDGGQTDEYVTIILFYKIKLNNNICFALI